MLRLRLCGHWLLDMPIEPRFFHFIRHAGLFHYLIEDMPHALVVIAAQLDCHDDGEPCLANQSTLALLGWDTHIEHSTIAKLSLCFSLGSILFGLANKTVQHAILSMDEGVPAQLLSDAVESVRQSFAGAGSLSEHDQIEASGAGPSGDARQIGGAE